MEGQVQRQLLIALLAIQGGLVSKEQLLKAFSQWESERSQCLEDILCEHGALTDAQRNQLIEQLDQNLSVCGDDLATCLKTQELDQSFNRTIQEVGDQELFATLLSSQFGTATAHQKVDADRTDNETDRYHVVRPHARGGLGIVSVAYDRQLNRQVALKEIRIERAMDTGSQVRFVQEAEITGQLEHPGIVPVYGLGTFKDGRPYYAMRFVEGQNFKVAIRAFHQGRNANESLEGETALNFRKLLGRLLHVCQAIEYAHSRNVLHRDLKPDNILLGPYGETLVVDWGLAKAKTDEAAQSKVADEEMKNIPRPVLISSGSSSDTVDGSAIGTPAYMSPEQASGRVAELGPATDIYSLGATLFSLLTGAAPVTGKSPREMVEKAKVGDRGRIRDYWPSAPSALVSICNKAMAQEPANRYPTSRAFAEDIERWLADAPVSAHHENLVERASRFVRKNQTACVSSTILLTAMLGFAFVATWYQSRLAIKDLESKNLQLHAQEQELFAEINAASQRAAKRQPGWTWINEATLIHSSKKSTNEQSARVLREEIARTMISSDVRRVSTIIDDLTISSIAFSTDGKLLAVGENTATFLQVHVRLLDAETHQTIKTLNFSPSLSNVLTKIETDGVSSLCFSSDNRSLFVGSRGGEVLQFELSSYKVVARWEVHQSRVDDLGVSDDGNTLVSTSRDGTTKWWNIVDRKLLKAIDSQSYRRIVKATNGFFALNDGLRRFSWNAETKEPARRILDVKSTVIAASPGLIASASSDEIQLYNQNGVLLRKMHPNPPMDGMDAISIGNESKHMVTHNGRSFDVWETVSGNKIGTISGVEIAVCAVDPRRPRVFIAGGKLMDFYEIRDHASWSALPIQDFNISTVKISGNRRVLTTASLNPADSQAMELRQFDCTSLETIRSGRFTIDGNSAWTLNHDGTGVTYVDSKTRKLLELDLENKTTRPWMEIALDASNVQYAQDGNAIWTTYRPRHAASTIEKLESWRVAKVDHSANKPQYEWNNQVQQLTKRYSDLPDLLVGKKYIAASTRQSVMIWESDPLKQSQELPLTTGTISRLAFVDDEQKLVVGDRKGQLFWIDLKRLEDSQSKPIEIEGQSGAITALSHFGNENVLLVGDVTGEIAVWQFRSTDARLIGKLGPFQNAVESIHSLSDGRRVAIHLRHETTVRILDLEPIFEKWRTLGLMDKTDKSESR